MVAVGDAAALPALARLLEERTAAMELDVLAAAGDPAALPRSALPMVSPADASRVRVRMVAGEPGSAGEIIDGLAGPETPRGSRGWPASPEWSPHCAATCSTGANNPTASSTPATVASAGRYMYREPAKCGSTQN